MTDAIPTLARWSLFLSEFDFEVGHNAHVKHQGADGHLLLPTTGGIDLLLAEEAPSFSIASVQSEDEGTKSDKIL